MAENTESEVGLLRAHKFETETDYLLTFHKNAGKWLWLFSVNIEDPLFHLSPWNNFVQTIFFFNLAYSKLTLGVIQQRFKKKLCWAIVSENVYNAIDDNTFCPRISNDKGDNKTRLYQAHTLPNMRLEDLKTLTLSVQAQWMFTPGDTPSEFLPFISFPFSAVTSELFYSAQTSDLVIFPYSWEMTLPSTVPRKQKS